MCKRLGSVQLIFDFDALIMKTNDKAYGNDDANDDDDAVGAQCYGQH